MKHQPAGSGCKRKFYVRLLRLLHDFNVGYTLTYRDTTQHAYLCVSLAYPDNSSADRLEAKDAQGTRVVSLHIVWKICVKSNIREIQRIKSDLISDRNMLKTIFNFQSKVYYDV